MILHPVLARVPRGRHGRAGVEASRALAQRALDHAASLARPEGERTLLAMDTERAPLPSSAGGTTWHWSRTNTTGLVAALVSSVPVGIDAEWLDRPRIEAALEYFDESERAALGLDERRGVLALWCAKEAVLKETRIGLAGMARVRLLAADGDRLTLGFDQERHCVRLLWEGEHVLAISSGSTHLPVRPALLEAALA